MQVDDWNERRKFREQEDIYLEQLTKDLETMQSALAAKVERATFARDRMQAALFTLEDCDSSEGAKADLDFALERYQVLGPFNYLGATYDEMVQTGALARIRDEAIKQKITYTFSELADINNNSTSFRVSMPVVDTIVWRSVAYSIDRDSGRPTVAYDLEALCDDREMRNALVEMVDIQWDHLTGIRRALSSVNGLLADLELRDAD